MPIEFLTPSSGAVPAPGTVPGPASGDGPSLNLWGSDGFTFADLLDFINPLQHIPVVSTIYRSLTGDEIGNAARIVGGAALGGIGGAVTSLIDATVELATGKDIGGHVLAMIRSGAVATDSQLAEYDEDGIENVAYENAPETILVAMDDTTFDQDIAAARTAVAAENVASRTPATPVNNAAVGGAARKQSKTPATAAIEPPGRAGAGARVARPRGQAGPTPHAARSPMASPNMGPSNMVKGAFAGGSSLPAGSALYAAEPANAVAALMANAKLNATSQTPIAQTLVGSPFGAATPPMGDKNMAGQAGGQPFWLGLMAENAEKAKSQNLIGVASQPGKTLAQYRAAARLITSPGPAKQIYR